MGRAGRCPLRVISRHTATTFPTSAFGGKADANHEAVGRLLDGADLLMVGGAAHLLAPVSDAVLDALAMVGADTEDMEPETTESDGDDEDYTVAV